MFHNYMPGTYNDLKIIIFTVSTKLCQDKVNDHNDFTFDFPLQILYCFNKISKLSRLK